MITQTIINKLRSLFQNAPKVSLSEQGDNWVDMGVFLRAVGKAGINYKNIGYERFGEFLNASELFSICTDYSSDKPIKYLALKSIQQFNEPQYHTQHKKPNSPSISHEHIEKIKNRLRLKNNQFIGQFIPQNEGWYRVFDIRNTEFTKIEDKERGIQDLSIPFRSDNYDLNKFATSVPLKLGRIKN